MEEWELQHVKYCNGCKRYIFPNPVYYDMNRTCSECGDTCWVDTGVPYYEYDIIGIATDDNEEIKHRMIKLKKDNPLQYESLLSMFRQKVREQEQDDCAIKCPHCGSTNIQLVSKKWSLLTGFFTNKVNRFCVACKTKF